MFSASVCLLNGDENQYLSPYPVENVKMAAIFRIQLINVIAKK
jgi:hypothetical protein